MNKKIFGIVGSLILIIALGLLFKTKQTSSALQSLNEQKSFQASLDFSMKSDGSYYASQAESISIMTQLAGQVQVGFLAADHLLKMTWTPNILINVNGVDKTEYEKEFKSIQNEVFYAHLNDQMVIDEIIYLARGDISPEVQDLLLNFNKMLAHQVAWLVLSEKNQTGVDIWGTNTLATEVSSDSRVVKTNSSHNRKDGQRGEGAFTIKLNQGQIASITGEQLSVLGDPQQPNAKTKNDYEVKVQDHRELEAQKLDKELKGWQKSVAWIVVDAKAMKAAALRDKLKSWDAEKVKQAVFNYKPKKDAKYSDIAELSLLLEEMLFVNPSLAKEYYEWLLKLGPKHPLYDEFIKSFSVAGCAECQKYLLEAAQQYKDDRDASQKALIGVGFLENPSEETEEKLKALAQDQAFLNNELAEYMVGTMANQLSNKAQDRALNIDADYAQKLKETQTARGKRRFLTVLGNAGVCSDLDVHKNLLRDSDIEVRKDAVLSMRFCKQDEVAETYIALFKNNPELRDTIFQAIDMRFQKDMVDGSLMNYFSDWAKNSADEKDRNLVRAVLNLLQSAGLRGDELKQFYTGLVASCSQYKFCAEVPK